MLKLRQYQRDAIAFGLKQKEVYYAVDMGLGKTAICLKIIEESKQPAIVFAPLTVILTTWPEEIEKWTPQLTYKILHGPNKTLKGHEKYDILLINYEGVKWFSNQKCNWKPRTVILDESTKVKSHATARFRILQSMRPLWGDYKFCLSATPAPNTLHELWAQYYLLEGHNCRLGKNITAFRRRYCYTYSFPGLPTVLYKVHAHKKQEIKETIAPITYRLEAKDYLQLPPVTYNKIVLPMAPKLMNMYNELDKKFVLELTHGVCSAASITSVAMKLRQFVQGGVYNDDHKWQVLHREKIKQLKEVVETSAGQPILCCIQFKGELDMILKEFGRVPLIAGGIPAQEKAQYIKKWNAGSLPLLICHPASLSHGVNLQSGGHIILWYALPWSFELYYQLNGRLYRQGQQHGVIVHHLLMQGTIDEYIFEALQKKKKTHTELMDYLRQAMLKRK